MNGAAGNADARASWPGNCWAAWLVLGTPEMVMAGVDSREGER